MMTVMGSFEARRGRGGSRWREEGRRDKVVSILRVGCIDIGQDRRVCT